MKKNQYQGQINLGYIHEEEVDNQDDNTRDNGGWTAVMFAAYCGNRDIVQYLHQAGADLNIRSNSGSTAVMLAAYNGHRDIVRYLRAAGAAK